MPDDLGELETELRLVGLVGIADPPRAAVAEAVATCRAAGITPVMITGDHAGTAAAIARRLGILTSGGVVLTGAELDCLDADALAERVSDIQVYARSNPEQKLRIVDAWRAQDAVVAMTGDGVNDAPALQRADIGVAWATEAHWLPVSPVPWVSSIRRKSSMNRPVPYQAAKMMIR